MSSAVEQLVTALVSADREGAYRLADEQAERLGSTRLYSEVFAPAMREVGELWASHTISVAQEHIATGLMEELLALDYRRVFVRSPGSRETVLAACVEGERHALGLRMCANLLEGAGFRVVFLGPDLSAPDIAAAADAHGPAAVVMAAYGAGRAAALADAVRHLRSHLPREVPLLVGGTAADASAGEGDVTVVADVGEIVEAVDAAIAGGRGGASG